MIEGKFIQKYGVEEKFDFDRFWDMSGKSLLIYDWAKELHGSKRTIISDGNMDTHKRKVEYIESRPYLSHYHLTRGMKESDYESDYIYEEFYQAADERFIDLVSDWIHEEIINRGYHKSK